MYDQDSVAGDAVDVKCYDSVNLSTGPSVSVSLIEVIFCFDPKRKYICNVIGVCLCIHRMLVMPIMS